MAHTYKNERSFGTTHIEDSIQRETEPTLISSVEVEKPKNKRKKYKKLSNGCNFNNICREDYLSTKVYEPKQSIIKGKCHYYLKQFSKNRQLLGKEIKDTLKKMKIHKSGRWSKDGIKELEFCENASSQNKENNIYIIKNENDNSQEVQWEHLEKAKRKQEMETVEQTEEIKDIEKKLGKDETQKRTKERKMKEETEEKEVTNLKEVKEVSENKKIKETEEKEMKETEEKEMKETEEKEMKKTEEKEMKETEEKEMKETEEFKNEGDKEETGETQKKIETRKEEIERLEAAGTMEKKVGEENGKCQQNTIEYILHPELMSIFEKDIQTENTQSCETEKKQKNIEEYEENKELINTTGNNFIDNVDTTVSMHKCKNELDDSTTESNVFSMNTTLAKSRSEIMEGNTEMQHYIEKRTNNINIVGQKKEIDNERLRYIFSILNMGIQKIETIKAMCRGYKENFNKSMREKMEKINSLIFYSNYNNFGSKFTVECLQNHCKLNNIKEERIGRLYLYIEDINKIKQALKMHQKEKCNTNGTDYNSEKNESFYDAIENIEDFFIFDDSLSCCLNNEDMESVLANSECKTVSFLHEDDLLDDFLEDLKKNKSERQENEDIGNIDTNENNDTSNGNTYKNNELEKENTLEGEKTNTYSGAFNRFPKFSFKNYYCFDINKNLCYIYSYTPMILKKLSEMLPSYNVVKTDETSDNTKPADATDKSNGNFDRDCQKNDGIRYYHRYAVDGGHNLDTYIQFHCEKWQENLYDSVEVNSIDVEFNLDSLKCSITQLF